MSKERARVPLLTRTRYGAGNPERVDNPLWERAVRESWTGYDLRRHLGADLVDDGAELIHWTSRYRETTPGPFWSWKRFGRTSTRLADGRIIHVAGEHEDWYDPDFCIYNDVLVEHPAGRLEFCLYAGDVFPPTDFHSATLVGGGIILIGSLGYVDLRRIGHTQVLRLDTRTLRIAPVATRGEAPGWISRHRAERHGEAAIRISGGGIQTPDGTVPNTAAFTLELATMAWRRTNPRKHRLASR